MCFYKRRLGHRHREEDHRERMGKRPRKQTSKEVKSASTVISDFYPQELLENKFLLFKSHPGGDTCLLCQPYQTNNTLGNGKNTNLIGVFNYKKTHQMDNNFQ